MALVFPTNPIDGQLFDRYIYNDAKGVWDIIPDDVFPYYVGPTKPTSPKEGYAWFNTENATTYMYYDDGVAGTITRTNLVTNPSFETDLSGWTTEYIAGAMRYSGAYNSGAYSVGGQVDTQQTTGLFQYSLENIPSSTENLICSAYVKTLMGTVTSFRVDFINVDPVLGQQIVSGSEVSASTNWGRAYVEVPASLANTSNVVYVRVVITKPSSILGAVAMDSVLVERASSLGDYFDGSFSGASWIGTAHASRSTINSISGSSGQWVATSGTVIVPNTNQLALLDDIGIASPSDGDVITYDANTALWVNSNPKNEVVRLNPKTISENLTIPSGYNGTSAGPLTISDGVVVTVADGSAWSVI